SRDEINASTSESEGTGEANGHQNSTASKPAAFAAAGRSSTGSSVNKIEQLTSKFSPYVRMPTSLPPPVHVLVPHPSAAVWYKWTVFHTKCGRELLPNAYLEDACHRERGCGRCHRSRAAGRVGLGRPIGAGRTKVAQAGLSELLDQDGPERRQPEPRQQQDGQEG